MSEKYWYFWCYATETKTVNHDDLNLGFFKKKEFIA